MPADQQHDDLCMRVGVFIDSEQIMISHNKIHDLIGITVRIVFILVTGMYRTIFTLYIYTTSAMLSQKSKGIGRTLSSNMSGGINDRSHWYSTHDNFIFHCTPRLCP